MVERFKRLKMTSIDAVAALFLFFFVCQFLLFLALSWIARKNIKILKMIAKEFQKESKFWNSRARKESFLRKMEKQ